MGTKYHGSTEERRALDVYIKLMRAAETTTGCVNEHLRSVNLTVSQFGVLEALYHLGPMCQSDLAEKILKSSGNLTTVIDNLSKRKLVSRQRDVRDRRRIEVSLSAEGRQLIADIFPAHVRGVVTTFSTLSPEEQSTLGKLLRKLGTSIRS